MATAWSAASKARLKSNLVRRDVSASEVRSWVVRDIARTITDGGMDGRPNPGAQVREILIAHHPLVAVPGRPLTEPEPDATDSVEVLAPCSPSERRREGSAQVRTLLSSWPA